VQRVSWRRVKVTFLRLLHLHDSPQRTAAAFAIGIFWGMSPITPPFFGLQTGMALFCAFIFRLNKIAALVGTLISNPFSFMPFYMFGTYVGSVILGYDLNVNASTLRHFFRHFSLKEMFSSPIAHAYFAGNFITATIASLAGYFILVWFIGRYRRLRESRRKRLRLET